jgi:hypothetical protein
VLHSGRALRGHVDNVSWLRGILSCRDIESSPVLSGMETCDCLQFKIARSVTNRKKMFEVNRQTSS